MIKIKTKVLSIIIALATFMGLFGLTGATNVKASAQDTNWAGYYETYYDVSYNGTYLPIGRAVLQVASKDIPVGNYSKIRIITTVDQSEVEIAVLTKQQFTYDRVSGVIEFWGLEEYDYNDALNVQEDYLKMNGTYTLRLTGNGLNAYEAQFTYLSRAISTQEDIEALDIKNQYTQTDGYFVLLNDLVIDDAYVPRHLGTKITPTVDVNDKDLENHYFLSGFSGVFDGKGHSITFTSYEGLFGRLVSKKILDDGSIVIHNYLDKRLSPAKNRIEQIIGTDGQVKTLVDEPLESGNVVAVISPTIKNVGFIDININTAVGQEKRPPVIARKTDVVYNENKLGLLEDIYIRTLSTAVPDGTIFYQRSVWMEMNRVVVDCPEQQYVQNDSWGTAGALFAVDGNKYSAAVNNANDNDRYNRNDYDKYMKDIYVVANLPLVYQKPGAATQQGKGSWYMIYGANEITEDRVNGKLVYDTVRAYDTWGDMANDTQNNYETFESESEGCWDLSFGVPVWKSAKERLYSIFAKTEAYVNKAEIHLVVGENEYIQFGFGLGNVAVQGVEVDLAVTRGNEYIHVENGRVTAIDYNREANQSGIAKITVSTTYNEQLIQKEFTVITKKPTPQEPENPPQDNNDGCTSAGCASVGGPTDYTGGMFMFVGLAVVFAIKKKVIG